MPSYVFGGRPLVHILQQPHPGPRLTRSPRRTHGRITTDVTHEVLVRSLPPPLPLSSNTYNPGPRMKRGALPLGRLSVCRGSWLSSPERQPSSYDWPEYLNKPRFPSFGYFGKSQTAHIIGRRQRDGQTSTRRRLPCRSQLHYACLQDHQWGRNHSSYLAGPSQANATTLDPLRPWGCLGLRKEPAP